VRPAPPIAFGKASEKPLHLQVNRSEYGSIAKWGRDDQDTDELRLGCRPLSGTLVRSDEAMRRADKGNIQSNLNWLIRQISVCNMQKTKTTGG
jgi:hypothetical protein